MTWLSDFLILLLFFYETALDSHALIGNDLAAIVRDLLVPVELVASLAVALNFLESLLQRHPSDLLERPLNASHVILNLSIFVMAAWGRRSLRLFAD